MWDEDFEQLLREHLPFVQPEDELGPDMDLTEFGLDSMGIVQLMVAIEQHFDVRFEPAALSVSTFATPGRLWQTVAGMLGEQRVSEPA